MPFTDKNKAIETVVAVLEPQFDDYELNPEAEVVEARS